jgi:hypothetical protein
MHIGKADFNSFLEFTFASEADWVSSFTRQRKISPRKSDLWVADPRNGDM